MTAAPRKTTVELSVSTMRALARFRRVAALLNPDGIDQDAYDVAARLARDVDEQAKRDAAAAATAPKVCAACSTPITSPWSRARYCSPRCADRTRKAKKLEPVEEAKREKARELWALGHSVAVIAREVGWGKRTDLVLAAVGGAP